MILSKGYLRRKLKTLLISQSVLLILITVFVVFLAFYNLTNYPLTWYDEGSHLHVPKALVLFGVYADYSSEGFRHYGPSIGIGPTVLLPIAAVFKVFGIGLLQARLVMALYSIVAVIAYYQLARIIGGSTTALVAILLLLSTRGVNFVEVGRNVLGEVPALFFLVAGLVVWFSGWDQNRTGRLFVVGLLLGLAMVTKYQFIIFIIPTFGLGWLSNWLYYKTTSHKNFIIPGFIGVLIIALWQAYQIIYLGPSTAGENFTLFREFTAGAAAVFSPDLIRRSINELLDFKTFGGVIIPVVVYGVLISLPRNIQAQRWGMLITLIIINLIWYVFASISWLRYAFPALALLSLFVAKFFSDLTDGFEIDLKSIKDALRGNISALSPHAVKLGLLLWLGIIIALPMGLLLKDILLPPYNSPKAVAQYLNENIPHQKLVETFEPELGFLTDHNYHFPPQIYLLESVKYIWNGGEPPSQSYHFVETEQPDYIIVGEFGRWVNMYPQEKLEGVYRKLVEIDKYEIFEFIK